MVFAVGGLQHEHGGHLCHQGGDGGGDQDHRYKQNCPLLQVVNTGIQAALDEFVNKWVMKEKERLLETNTYMSMQRVLQEAGHNLGTLVDNLIELVLHFADPSGSPVSVSFQ